jgi:hypothetical protein
MSANIILLDRILARYGVDANEACALSGSGAVQLILELESPFTGLIRISEARYATLSRKSVNDRRASNQALYWR